MGRYRLAICLLATCSASPLRAMEWDWTYNGRVRPQDVLPSIKFHGDPAACFVGPGGLRLVNAPGPKGPWATYVIRDIGASNRRGVTIEARAKLVTSAGEHHVRPGLQFYIADNHCAEALLVCDGWIETRYSVMRYDVDTTSDYRVYRLTARGDDFRVYVDGKLAINGKGLYLGTRSNMHRLTWLDAVRFGVGNRWAAGEGFINYLRYTTQGAFGPDGRVDPFDTRGAPGRKVAIAPVAAVRAGMEAGLNEHDPAVPKLGSTVKAPILYESPKLQLWLQDATTKVFRSDAVEPGPTDPTVRIALARNEYEPFQVVLRPKTAGLRGVRVEFSDLVSRNGSIGRKHLTFRPVAYLKIWPEATMSRGKVVGKPGYWPDGLVPFDSFDAKHQLNYPMWVTLYCPPDTPPGRYRGSMVVKGGGLSDVRLALHVTVWGFTLPRTPRLTNHFLMNNVYNSVESSMEVFKGMYRQAAEHRGSPSRLFPGLKCGIRNGEVWIDPDNAPFVAMARYCIDDLGIKHFWFPHIGPHQMLGWFERNRKDRRFLGVKMYTDERPYNRFTPEFEERLVDYLRAASAFLKAKGLFEHFNCLTSHNEPACPPAWRALRSFDLEARYCDLVHRADPDYRVFMNMALVVGQPELSKIQHRVSLWAENTLGSKFQLADRVGWIKPGLVRERQRAGDEVWMYRNSHDYVDIGLGSSAMNHRVNGWIMWVTGATGYYFDNGGIAACLWNPGAWRKIGRPWHGQMQWGAGSQMYPSENLCGFEPSVRFELTREAYEDYEYLATVGELAKAGRLTPEQTQLVRRLEESIVPLYCWWRDGRDPAAYWQEGVYEGSYESDAKKLYRARQQLGEMIHSALASPSNR